MGNTPCLRSGVALAALIVAASFSTGIARAQEQSTSQSSQAGRQADREAQDQAAVPTPVTSAPEEEIIVTGTSIRGVAPIGSNLVSVGQETIEKTAAVNLSQLVNTVPSISTSGSVAQGENAYSYYSPQIHSLAGSSSNTTLVIVDGLRLPGGGTQFAQTDPNIIPTPAIQRVEVLADGASSVYGSDAVAGVVNFITRSTFEGLETNAAYGFGDHYHNYDLNFIWGTKWDTGGVYIAGQYSNQSELLNKDRSFSSLGDYRSIGGSNTQSFQCSPATIQVTAVSSGAAPSGVFLSPGATSTVANTANNAPCNNSVYATLLPSQFRANALMKVVNEFSDRLTVTAMLNYNYQKTHSPAAPGGLTNATVFGAGQGVAGQANPFFVAPAGAPNATRENITWLALRDDGNYGSNESEEDVIYATAKAEYKIAGDWTVTLSDAFGKNRSAGNALGTFCQPCALLALNGTAQLSGSTTASNVAGQNVIALNLPLNASNALDVWSPLGSNRTSEAVLRRLYANSSENTNYNTFNQLKLDFQGSLFPLPAGEMKLAVGGEYFWHTQTQKITATNNTGPTTTGSNFRVYDYDRNIKSAYAEVVIPVISPEMHVPLAYRVDLNVSGRYDTYSDVGDTTNPKIAANWEIVEGLKLRGNWATAFVAPPLAVIGDPSQGYLYASGSVGTQGNINVPVANYPEVVNVPGAVQQNTNLPCTTASVSCTIGQGNSGMRRQLGGGFTGEVPQKGRSWSVGVDFAPRFLPGFTAAVTFFHNTFIGGVSSPSASAIVNSAGLHNLLTICPSGCSQTQILDFANVANGATISGAIPANVYFLLDQSTRNALNLKVEGIDAQFTYHVPLGSDVSLTIGSAATYFTKFKQNFGGGTEFSILNTSGYNTTFPSVQFKNRAQLGIEAGSFSADAFWNHTGGYRNWISTTVAPIIVDSVGNPVGGGDWVEPDNTFDLNVQYQFSGDKFFKGWIVYANIRNLLDKDPPFYNGNTAGILGGAWGYNGFVSNPVGRLVTLGLRTRF
jgi:iron complex outermembrane receptor protein